jgi:hypothetical protein
MVDTSLNNKNTVITLETQTKYIKAAEYICETLDLNLNKYLNDCILCGVNADLEDQFIFSKSNTKKTLIDCFINIE